MTDEQNRPDAAIEVDLDTANTTGPSTTPESLNVPEEMEATGAESAPEVAPIEAVSTEPSDDAGSEAAKDIPPVVAAAQKSSKKKPIILAASGVALVAIIATAVYFVLSGNKQPEVASTTQQQAVVERKMGLAATVVDGQAEYRRGDASWQTLSTNTQLKEGDSVRTGEGARVVLTLDDGSAVRLDASSELKLSSLAADDIRLTQINGMVYSRVVPSERKYAVKVDKTNYQALGTAFVTVAKTDEKGVQVYQSSVKVDGQATSVAEGKQYYNQHTNVNLKDKVTDIDLDAVSSNEFVAWNLTEDEKDTKFKDKLGVLAQVKQKSEEKARQSEAEEKARKDAETKAQKDKNDKTKDTNRPLVTRGTMSLTLSGDTFGWSYTGSAVHGYKLVYAEAPAIPTFGVDKADYHSDINTKSAKINSLKAGKTYNVRVCAYTSNTESEACVDYSNTVQIVAS